MRLVVPPAELPSCLPWPRWSAGASFSLWEVPRVLFSQISQEQLCQPMALWVPQELHPGRLALLCGMPWCIAEHGIVEARTNAQNLCTILVSGTPFRLLRHSV